MIQERFEVVVEDGWCLDVLYLPATEPVRGVALLGHAMMVDRRSLDLPKGKGLASTLAANGWEGLLPDLRGRGASGPSAAQGADWAYDDLVRYDLPACVAAARQRFPGLPLVVVGHSLSGHVSAAAEGAGYYGQSPDAHVFFAVNMWAPSLEPLWWRRRLKGLAAWGLGVLVMLFGRFPSRWIRMGPVDEAATYMRDIVRFWTEDQWKSEDGSVDYQEGLAEVSGPVLAWIGVADRLLAQVDAARQWTDGLSSAPVDFRLVGRGDLGLAFDPDHMTLVTDERARPVWLETVRWLDQRLLGSSDGD
ncbi:MAG TPA: hypothetical protein DIU15_10290 [Deltaproteobacteria bacterium]|nr:hypothetical protein [Deltaproteobacteria bacterium]